MAQHVKFIVSANEAYLVVFTARDNVHLVLPIWPMYRVLNAWRMSLCTNVFTSSLPLCFFFCLSSLPPSPRSLPPSLPSLPPSPPSLPPLPPSPPSLPPSFLLPPSSLPPSLPPPSPSPLPPGPLSLLWGLPHLLWLLWEGSLKQEGGEANLWTIL